MRELVSYFGNFKKNNSQLARVLIFAPGSVLPTNPATPQVEGSRVGGERCDVRKLQFFFALKIVEDSHAHIVGRGR